MTIAAARTDFRNLYAKIPEMQELGDSLIDECIRQAVRRYSVFRPRKNRKASINLLPSDTQMLLPSDFMFVNQAELFLGLTGLFVDSLSNLTINLLNFVRLDATQFYETFDTQLGATNFPPPPFRNLLGDFTVALTTNDNGEWVLEFAEAFGDTRTVKFLYTAFHQITPTIYTIPVFDRYTITELAMGYASLALFRKWNPTDERKASGYKKMAMNHFKILEEISPLGAVG